MAYQDIFAPYLMKKIISMYPIPIQTVMAHFHQRRRTRIWIWIWISNPIVTLYYAQLFPLVWIQIQIPVWIVSRMVTVPI